jgi:hypothetical protein
LEVLSWNDGTTYRYGVQAKGGLILLPTVEFFILAGDVVNPSFHFLPTSFTRDEAERLLPLLSIHILAYCCSTVGKLLLNC